MDSLKALVLWPVFICLKLAFYITPEHMLLGRKDFTKENFENFFTRNDFYILAVLVWFYILIIPIVTYKFLF